jgi:hypothetical protein
VHSWFLPVKDDGLPDPLAAREASQLLKNMIIDSNGRTLWVATGSSMATFWSNLAKVPTNGYSLLIHRRQVRGDFQPFSAGFNPNLTVGTDIYPLFLSHLRISSVTPYIVEPSYFNGLVIHSQVLAGKAGFPAGWNYSPSRRAPQVL